MNSRPGAFLLSRFSKAFLPQPIAKHLKGARSFFASSKMCIIGDNDMQLLKRRSLSSFDDARFKRAYNGYYKGSVRVL